MFLRMENKNFSIRAIRIWIMPHKASETMQFVIYIKFVLFTYS